MSLSVGLKQEAQRLGFDAVGICNAAAFRREKNYLLTREFAPTPFEWPDLEARIEPNKVLPGVRSIIAVAMSYLMSDDESDQPAPSATALHGWLSRYCRGKDYHSLMEQRLQALADWLDIQAPDARHYIHVDVAAPLDRAIAERAGLGQFGKSTNFITLGLGCWTFLGELFTTIDLDADSPATWNACGTCTRCIDACPTQALRAWEIDSTRCLGYINQMDGAIPDGFRAALGNRLFGCDDCLDVCPYNHNAARDRHPEFAPLSEVGAYPDLIALLNMDETEFARVYGATAAAWRGLETLQRNALVILGNSGDAAAIAPLQQALQSPSALLREHAAWGLQRLAALGH
jgi:epoxyqueuosine reductase